MNIAVLNFSGNVGKTVLSTNMVLPRLNPQKVFSIESINVGAENDGVDVEQIKGKNFGAMIDEMMMLDSSLVDVGASNVEDFLKLMQQYDGSHEEFDYFIIPTIKEKKVQADTVNTITALSALGIPKDKILLVFNKVDVDDQVEDEFAALFGLAKLKKNFIISPNATVYHNEVYERLKSLKMTLGDLLNDDNDYRGMLRTAEPEKKADIVNMIAVQRLAKTANKNLDVVYQQLLG